MSTSVVKAEDKHIKNCLNSWIIAANEEQIKAGLSWYKDAQKFTEELSVKYNIDAYIIASVVSALSPNNKWNRNKIDTLTVIEAHLNGISPDDIKVCTYNANKLKAFRILNGELITQSAPKTHSFAMNVGLLSSDHITIDKWHLRACLLEPCDGIAKVVESCTAKQYRRIEAITAQIAKNHGYKGYEFQAIIWVTIKDHWNR